MDNFNNPREIEKGYLHVNLHSAQNLISADLNGFSDPYCILSLSNHHAVSKVVPKSLNPCWMEPFLFLVENKNDKLIVKVMDKDIVIDDFMGLAQIEISSLKNFEEVEVETNLSKVKTGSIKLHLRWISLKNPSKSILDRFGFMTKSQEAIEPKYPNERPLSISHMHTIARTGIPLAYKAAHWQIYSEKLFNINFSHLTENYSKFKSEKGNNANLHQILLDIPRTFPSHPAFLSPEGQASLQNVLMAYSVKNSALGYCQAMSFVAGALLLLFPEEGAFGMLSLITEHLIPGYWTPTLAGIQTDLIVLEHLFQIKLPELAKHFESIRADLGSMVTSWLMGLFLNVVPFSTVIRLWDYLFTRGSAYILIIAYSFLKLYSEKLLKFDDIGDLNKYLRDSLQTMYDWEKLIHVLNSTSVTPDYIQKLREEAKVKVDKRIKDRLMNDLKRTTFELSELESLYQEFMKLPKAAVNGSITEEQALNLVQNFKFGSLLKEKPDLKKLYIEFFDTNKDGSISFKEYCIGLSLMAKGSAQEKVTFAFKLFDQDGNGFIQREEMIELLRMQYKALGFDSKYQAENFTEIVFKSFDKNNDERLSLEEFQDACHSEAILTRLLQL